MELYTTAEMKRIEEDEIARGTSSEELICRAADALCARLVSLFGKNGRILLLCGRGNNGADGYALGKRLQGEGISCETLDIQSGRQSRENAAFKSEFIEAGGTVLCALPTDLSAYTLLVDAVYGSGFHGELRDEIKEVFRLVNDSSLPILSVDLPSGVDGSTGEADKDAIKASQTVCLTVYKIGAFVYPGAGYCGKVFLEAAIPALPSSCRVTSKPILRERQGRTNKGTFGTVGIVAGTKNMAGAAYLAAKAAYTMGAGLVRIVSEECNRVILQTLLPEAVLFTYDEQTPVSDILKALKPCTSLAVGPGLGQKEKQREIVSAILQYADKPTVLDADGLNLTQNSTLIEDCRAPLVLTPHPGEAARLLSSTPAEIVSSPVKALDALVARYDCTVLLKDAHTLVGCKDKRLVNLTGNSGMSKGGSGDVLTGIIAELLTEGFSPLEAASAGAYLHGTAGDLAAKKYGKRSMLASHIIEELPYILQGDL